MTRWEMGLAGEGRWALVVWKPLLLGWPWMVAVVVVVAAAVVGGLTLRHVHARLRRLTARVSEVESRNQGPESGGSGAVMPATGLDDRSTMYRRWLESLDSAGASQRERVSALAGDAQVLRDRVHDLSRDLGSTSEDLSRHERLIEVVEAGVRERLTQVDASQREGLGRLKAIEHSVAGVEEAVGRLRRNDVVLRRKSAAWETYQQASTKELLQLERLISNTQATVESVRAANVESSLMAGRPARYLVGEEQAAALTRSFLESGRVLPLVALMHDFEVIGGLNLTESRALFRLLRQSGYWSLQRGVAEHIVRLSGRPADEHLLRNVVGELKGFAKPIPSSEQQHGESPRAVGGPVLHVVGKSLPATQTGYTLRSGYTVAAQRDLGIPVSVVVQPGGDGQAVDEGVSVHDGIARLQLPGPRRADLPLDEWLVAYADALERVVRAQRPSLIHAHSDFLNGAAAAAVGRRCGVPVVYESRGFWEESWISRLGDALGLGENPVDHLRHFGLPDAYEMRRDAERQVRGAADAVLTLAPVMRAHIEHEQGARPLDVIRLVPNAVDASAFTPSDRDEELARALEIEQPDVVVGYVSSMVEYEGVDTLLRAVASLQSSLEDQRVHLLLVGDGAVLSSLRMLAERLGMDNVTFTGRVPHEDVSRYYSLIDIFVVPRRPTRVCQLVTPLKPFEAMAAGKAVVMSDVQALQEIADESGAVRTFRSGEWTNLRDVLADLVCDREARDELGEQARAWVTEHHTWESNARTALELYESLGCAWTGVTGAWALERLKARGVDAWVAAGTLVDGSPPWRGWFSINPRGGAHEVMHEGWALGAHPPVKLDEVKDWASFADQDRTWAFRLHAWEFVDAFVAGGRVTTAEEAQFLVGVVLDWNTSRLERIDSDSPDTSMAYYDMSLALRVPRLINVIVIGARHAETRYAVPAMIDLLMHDRDQLATSAAFNPRTNHGFYTAAAQLHLEKYLPGLPGSAEYLDLANDRMASLTRTQFAPDGGHLEHSPYYHSMLLGSFASAVDDALIVDDETVATISRARRVLGWMTQPDGRLVAFGDSEPRSLSADSALGEPSTTWIATDGAEGQPSSTEMLVLPGSGYAFVRSPQPQPGERLQSSYLAVQAGFHSRAHKHADDLSFVWFDHGQEICIDAGRYGYGELLPEDDPLRPKGFYYAAPERQYVESCRAHNTLEVDGVIHDRRRKAYGSGLLEGEKDDGAFVVVARARHDTYVHRRKLNLLPHKRLIVQDSLHSSTDQPREGTAWFLLSDSLELMEQSDYGAVFRLADGTDLRVSVEHGRVDLVMGQEQPFRGWSSPESGMLQPAWSLGVHFDWKVRAALKTEFRLEDGR